jgi:hypothetical protein
MADSDPEYIHSEEDELPSRRGGGGASGARRDRGKGKGRQRWEASVQERERPLPKEGKDGDIRRDLVREVEGRLRMRYV